MQAIKRTQHSSVGEESAKNRPNCYSTHIVRYAPYTRRLNKCDNISMNDDNNKNTTHIYICCSSSFPCDFVFHSKYYTCTRQFTGLWICECLDSHTRTHTDAQDAGRNLAEDFMDRHDAFTKVSQWEINTAHPVYGRYMKRQRWHTGDSDDGGSTRKCIYKRYEHK